MKLSLHNVNKYSNQGFKQRMLAGDLPPKSKDSLSFSGLTSALTKATSIDFNDTLTKVLDGRFGKMFDEFSKLTKDIGIKQTIEMPKNGTSKIIFNERSLAGKAIDQIQYFFKGIWLDGANGILEGLKKLKIVADSDLFKNVYNSKILTKQRKLNEANDLFYSMLGVANKHNEFWESLPKDKRSIDDLNYKLTDFMNESLKKPRGAYSAKSERAFNRLVTGAVSASFVGRDFYNLTMYQTNDKDKSHKSQRKRVNQELTRVSLSALLSFSVLGIFSKWTNKNMKAAVALTGLTTLFAEVVSRLKNGVSLVPLSPKKAKEIHDKKTNNISHKGQNKDSKNTQDQIAQQANNTYASHPIQKELTNINSFISTVNTNPQNLKLNRIDTNNKNVNQEDSESQSQDKKQSIFKKLGKILGVALAIGFGWDVLTRVAIKPLKKKMAESGNDILKYLSDFKNNAFYKDRKVPEETMKKILDALRKTGNKDLAELYEKNLGPLSKDGEKYFYTVGKIARKKAIPLRIPEKIMEAVRFPYECLIKLLRSTLSIETENKAKLVSKIPDNIKSKMKPYYNATKRILNSAMAWEEKVEKTDAEQLKDAIGVLYDEVSGRNLSGEELTKAISKRMESIFNDNSFIKYKQADLAMWNRTVVTAIASYFFVNDFRNQVLIDSAGKDTKRAEEVTNERIGHKVTNFITNAFLMNFFNTTLSKIVMGSLPGAIGVAAATEYSNESLIRFLIGVPIGKKDSKEAIQDFETKSYYSKGMRGKWTRFVSKLTGKKPISEKAKADKK